MMAHTMDKSLEDGRLGILEERQGKGRGKMKNERKKAKKIAFDTRTLQEIEEHEGYPAQVSPSSGDHRLVS
jgi:hypothetical protein